MKKFLKVCECSALQWNRILSGTVLSLISLSCWAGTVAQTPLFLTTNVKPNIMLMVDNSGSMNETVAQPSVPYDPATTYLASVNCTANPMPNTTTTTRTIDLNTQALCSANGGTWSNRRNRCTPRQATVNVVTPIVYNASVPNVFFGKVTRTRTGSVTGRLCFDPGRAYVVSPDILFPAGVTTLAQRANYLNWYYSDQLAQSGSGNTRMSIVKSGAIGLVNSLDSNVRMGLATFVPSTASDIADGGQLLEVIDDLGPTKKSNIINRINWLTPQTWTPLAEVTSGIGHYFATGNAGNVKLKVAKTGESSQTVSSVLKKNLANGTGWTGRTAIPAAERSGTEPIFSTAPIQAWCQKCFTVLVTDGLPTQDQDIASILHDYDGDCSGTYSTDCLSASPNYDLKKAYFSSVPGSNPSDYLDDVAQALYEMDLRPDLTKKTDPDGVIRSKNNIVTYTIGIADPDINPTLPNVNPVLKEAADQAGGQFFFANNASELSASLQRALEDIVRQDASSSSVAANSTQFRTGALLFQALFNSSDWSGNIRAYNLTTEDLNDNGKLDAGEDTNGNGKIDAGDIGTARWNADVRIPGNRNIFSFNAVTGAGIKFEWQNLNDKQKSVIDSTAYAANASSSSVLDYLIGDRSKEGDELTDFRQRGSILGDVVNSDPHFVGGEDMGYTSLTGGEGQLYADHLAIKKNNPEMIYVGANDGMLHAFKVTVVNPASVSEDEGVEQFAYVPNSVISQELATLKDKSYAHKFYVDGSPQSGDVFYDGGWHTILVGGTGAGSTTPVASSTSLATGVGGRGLFALDISDPLGFDETKARWEFTNRQDSDLGYVLNRVSIARMNNGQWVAIVNNGYNSTNGKAVLYILDIKTGAIIKKLIADNGTGNGLSGPTPVDVDGDKSIDYIYAGDLKGNLWKFDVTSAATQVLNSAAADQWHVAYSGNPVFVATDSSSVRQPITVVPAVTTTVSKTAGQDSGIMIYFGTGKYFESGDHSSVSQQTQSFYGIWDKCDKTSTSCDGRVSGRSELQQQSIILQDLRTFTGLNNTTNTEDIRVTTNCDVSYGDTGPTPATTTTPCNSTTQRKGWYLDLLPPDGLNKGERVVSNPIIRNDTVIFPTLIPIDVVCEPSGTSYLMELALNGSRFSGSPIDLNRDGKINDDDLVLLADGVTKAAVSGLKSKVGIIKTPAVINCEDELDCKYLTGSTGSLMDVKERAPGGNPPGGGGAVGKRISWRQLR